MIDAMAPKKTDPNFLQISGHVPKELGLKFKSLCAVSELSLSEGLEKALNAWIDLEQKKEKESK